MLFFLFFTFYIYAEKVFYNLNIKINPNENFISIEGYIEFERSITEEFFYLDGSVNLKKTDLSLKVEKNNKDLILYKVYDKNGKKFKKFYISYDGNFNYPINGSDAYARGVKVTKGIISGEGCFLTSQSGWYPIFENGEIYFDIKFHIPKDYEIVMPGFILEKKINNNEKTIRYLNKKPVFELTMTCGKYKIYSSYYNPSVYVYMINPDDELAKKYLDYSYMYIHMYEKLIGKYPYEKFAIVENFWETGFAFPSFTLLGKNVMRFPFIFITSLPHEILHNWWGNGVYVDYDKGNWSEGITTYLADYMFSEQIGKSRDYRVNVLKKYTDYVKDDIPLKDFKERHSNETEAVGYGKSMMLFHMLRKDMGVENFLKALKDFYNQFLYKKASWYDIKFFLEKYSKKDYSKLFDELIYKKGFYSARLLKDNIFLENNFISFSVLNDGDFEFEIPIRLYYKSSFQELTIELKRGINNFKLPIRDELFAICMDCEFDVLRKLSMNETPITFSKLISEKKAKIYSDFDLKDVRLFKDKDFASEDDAISIYIGKKYIKNLDKNSFVSFNGDNLLLQDKVYNLNENQFAFIFNNKDKDYVYFLCDNGCVDILNKIIHYGKYSYLVFDKNLNVIDTGVWDLRDRDNLFLFRNDYEMFYEKREPIYNEFVSFFKEKDIKKHIKYLSSKIKTRHPGSNGLEKAKRYIEEEFKKIGLIPLFDSSYQQSFKADIFNSSYILSNVCGKTGDSSSYLVVSAHYDHLFPQNGVFYPGANDNASGVAALIELAKKAKLDGKNGLIFCAFSGEEYGRIGSKYFLKNNNYKIYANINIDTIGRLYDKSVVILNSESSSLWASIIRKASLSTGVDYKVSKTNISASDDYSFIENNIAAIQIYDGSVDDYHMPTDIFEKIDFKGIIKALDFIKELVYEVRKKDTMPFDHKKNLNEIIKKRTISLGFAPDFSYNGDGLRIKKINSNSVLLNYGLKEGDIIVSINGIKIVDIFDYTSILNGIDLSKPISIEYISGGVKNNIDVIIK